MVKADQRDHLKDLFNAESRSKRKQSFLGAPGGVARITVDRGMDLLRRQGNPLGEECDVHAPLVGAAAARAGAVDHDLTVPE
jgi:phage FluMu protein gp41